MHQIQFIAQEAHKIHDWFYGLFYVLITLFLLFAVISEYFKLPLGGTPNFTVLLGRVLIAVLLLQAYPQISNLFADLSEGIVQKLGSLGDIKVALQKMGDKVHSLTWSWTSVKESLIVLICYLCFLILYFSVHLCNALYLYTMVLLYIFSPILIALYVLPQTAGATSGLFRSLIEASMWKPVWCVLGTILWSTGISDIQADKTNISFLSAICFSLLAAGSLIVTPIIVHTLTQGGISGLAKGLGNIAVPGLMNLTPKGVAKTSYSIGRGAATKVYNKFRPDSEEDSNNKQFKKGGFKMKKFVPKKRKLEVKPI
jgi:hypothetical protein